MRGLTLALLGLAVALPAAAQQRGGQRTSGPDRSLQEIKSNQGCPHSATSTTVGVNEAKGTASSAQQRLRTSGSTGSGCQPLVSTQVVTGVNLALGRGSNAGQSIAAQGPRGALATETVTTGYSFRYGDSTATQHLSNRTNRSR